MSAIESGASERTLIKIVKRHVVSLAERLGNTCPSDGVPLREGKCPVCRFERAPEQLPDMELVEPTDDQARLRAAFQKRYRGILAERELEAQARAKKTEPVTPTPSRAERALRFMGKGGLPLVGAD